MRWQKLVLLVCASAAPIFCGEISGKVLITRHWKQQTLPPVYDLRGAAPPAAVSPAVDSEFARTVVMLEGAPSVPLSPITASIDQRGARFEPEMLVVPVGSTVQFPNDDPIFHNVFSLSGARSFDLGYYPKGQSRNVKFDRPGVVQIYCHIHSSMYAAIVVTPSRWSGKPSESGAFDWSGIPAGHYQVVAWHKIAGFRRAKVDVPENGVANVTIAIPVDSPSNEDVQR